MLALYDTILFVNALGQVGNCGVLNLHLVSSVVMAVSLIPIAIPPTSSCSVNLAPLLSPPYTPKTKFGDQDIEDDNSTDGEKHSKHMVMVEQMKLSDRLGWTVSSCLTAMFDAILACSWSLCSSDDITC
jgi:hypothetical protein